MYTLFGTCIQEGEEDQLRDEAIRRNITKLVASAFGSHSPGSDLNDSTNSGIEVQEVTVYVDDTPHGNRVADGHPTIDGSGGASNIPQQIDHSHHEGSISIKNVPFIPTHFSPSSPPSNRLPHKPTSPSTGNPEANEIPDIPHDLTVRNI